MQMDVMIRDQHAAPEEAPGIPSGARRRLSRQIGFLPQRPGLYRAYNIAGALALLTLAAPILIIVSLLLLVTQGPGIFYRGPRLSKDGDVFYIYKFRTLNAAAAAALTSDKTLPKNSGIETPLGKFLRDTRLDELPQLLNVLFGDMNLCGPRPVRPEIAAIERARIPRYDMRFTVKPGLVGPAQALMSHGTSKRIRALFNNTACRRPVSIVAEIRLLTAIGWSVVRRTLSEVCLKLAEALLRAARRAKAWIRRMLDRLAGRDLHARLEVEIPEGAGTALPARLIEGGRMRIRDLARFEGEQTAILTIHLHGGGQRKARVVLVARERAGVFGFAPATPAAEHVVERYLLGLTVVGPARNRHRAHA